MEGLEFKAPTKELAIKKAINYWYSNFYQKRNFLDFINDCTWKKENNIFIVVYRGPRPEKED